MHSNITNWDTTNSSRTAGTGSIRAGDNWVATTLLVQVPHNRMTLSTTKYKQRSYIPQAQRTRPYLPKNNSRLCHSNSGACSKSKSVWK